MELLILIIGLSLAVFFTARFLLSLRKAGPVLPKFWDWVKHVFDSIT